MKYIFLILLILISVFLFASVKDATLDFFQKLNMPDWLIIIIISMLPIVELRGGIPIAVNIFNMNIFHAFILAYIGNILPVIPILLFLNHIYKFFSKWQFTKNIFDRFFNRTRSRSAQIEKYKMIGLISFVAIPLPVTGAWTGAVAAVLFNITFKHAIVSILIGVFVAGIIVMALSLMGILGAIIAGIALLILITLSIIKAYI